MSSFTCSEVKFCWRCLIHWRYLVAIESFSSLEFLTYFSLNFFFFRSLLVSSRKCLLAAPLAQPSHLAVLCLVSLYRAYDAASALRLPGAQDVSPAFSVHEDLSTGHLALEDAISAMEVALAHLRRAEGWMTGA
ncbi:hypothetical protein EYZ11_009264 [Aspergillus tanneri]|uniref:Uncharacterized protein n=1 Tax=Aspergillus tanneri TaxID=1220188 RepID=A0A4S3JAH6_9EURO|nr:hypothetical protein EYZ11_009264 [Aspergillus tanneri]